MRLRTVLVTTAATGAALVMSTGSAMAGEVNGNGTFTPNHQFGHSHSSCSFSGLEDGDGAGFPGPGGAAPQNWGHRKELYGATPAERKASGFQPGDSCNGHSGFVANPPPGAPRVIGSSDARSHLTVWPGVLHAPMKAVVDSRPARSTYG